MTIMHRLPLKIFLLILLISPACSGEEQGNSPSANASVSQQQEQAQIQWLDFDEGLNKATRDNKPIFIEFYTNWCVYCKKFRRETLRDQNVINMMAENFISVRLNAENPNSSNKYQGKSMSNVELTRFFGIRGFPSLVFLDPDANPITLVPGFMPAPQFLAILNYIDQRCYQTKISFQEFVQNGDCD